MLLFIKLEKIMIIFTCKMQKKKELIKKFGLYNAGINNINIFKNSYIFIYVQTHALFCIKNLLLIAQNT